MSPTTPHDGGSGCRLEWLRHPGLVREAQARATRQAIVEAARRLFLAHGYARTTLPAIAREAGVAVETIYATFATKRGVLDAVLASATRGENVTVPIVEQPWVQEVRRERNQRQQVRLIARNARTILERVSPIHAMMRAAAAVDQEIGAAYHEQQQWRLEALTEYLGWVLANGPLKPGLTLERAADVLWTIASPEVHALLRQERGWSADAYEQWLGDTLGDALLPPGDRSPAGPWVGPVKCGNWSGPSTATHRYATR